jgi:hypothetical protein
MGNFLAFFSADGVSIRVFLVSPKPLLVPGSTQVKKYCNNNGAALLFYSDKMDIVGKVGANSYRTKHGFIKCYYNKTSI